MGRTAPPPDRPQRYFSGPRRPAAVRLQPATAAVRPPAGPPRRPRPLTAPPWPWPARGRRHRARPTHGSVRPLGLPGVRDVAIHPLGAGKSRRPRTARCSAPPSTSRRADGPRGRRRDPRRRHGAQSRGDAARRAFPRPRPSGVEGFPRAPAPLRRPAGGWPGHPRRAAPEALTQAPAFHGCRRPGDHRRGRGSGARRHARRRGRRRTSGAAPLAVTAGAAWIASTGGLARVDPPRADAEWPMCWWATSPAA